MVQRLKEACYGGHAEAVERLIAAGADVNTCLGAGPPGDPKPLLWAVPRGKWTLGHQRVFELLLDAGADSNGGGPAGGLSPLVAAAEQGQALAVEILVRRGARVGFYEAIAIGDVARVESTLDEQPALVTRVRTCGVGIHGGPGDSLHFAALSGMHSPGLATVAERLIAAGSPVAGSGDNSYAAPAPLKRAARADNAAVAEVLLRHGADPMDGLAEALLRDAQRVVALLAPRANLVDLPGDPKLGNTLLDETLRYGRLKSARWLIERGARVDRPDKRGWTTLHYAVSRGVAPAVVEALLERGASPNARDAEGRTPLDVAAANGRVKLVPLLKMSSRSAG
jgi:ankyrin repeat protein